MTPTAVPTDFPVTTSSPEPSPTATSSPTATPVLVFIDSMWLGRVEASIYAASSKLFVVYDIVIDSQQIIVSVERFRDDGSSAFDENYRWQLRSIVQLDP